MSKGWDNAMIKKLKALTGKGLSTAEIGKRLGLSKNAVVGKLNRLGWNLKASSSKDATDDKTVAKAKKSVAPKKADVKPTKVAPVTKKSPTKASGAKKVVAPVASKKKEVTKSVAKTDTNKKSAPAQKVKAAPASKEKSEKKSLNKSLAMHQRIIQHSLEMANLKTNQCRWPIGDPDSENFHFCGETVFVGKPYCYEHCKQAYQFAPPKKK